MRTMYDSVSWRAIPANAAMVAGYDTDSIYAWPAEAWARFPAAVKIRIAVTASHNGGHVLDIETGDATPVQGPSWVRMRRAAGADPTVYCNQSTWPAVRAAFQQQGVAEPHYWIAAYNGNPEILPGSVAHQYNDPPGSGGDYDISSVVDFWPGVDGAVPTPAPPPPHPSGGQEDRSKVALSTGLASTHRDVVVVGADGNVYHKSGPGVGELVREGWENLGMPYEPYGVYAKTVSAGWTVDGSKFELTAHGSDNKLWYKTWDHEFGWLNAGRWVQDPTGVLAA